MTQDQKEYVQDVLSDLADVEHIPRYSAQDIIDRSRYINDCLYQAYGIRVETSELLTILEAN